MSKDREPLDQLLRDLGAWIYILAACVVVGIVGLVTVALVHLFTP